jgi:hypothetical protein
MKNMRSLLDNTKGVIDLGVVLMIGVAFAGLMVVAYILFTLTAQLGATGAAANTIGNITTGFDNAVALILVAITIFILALAISALLLLRGRQQ